MSSGISAFGQDIPKNDAKALLSNPSLNALPSPTTPTTMPKDNTGIKYGHVIFALYQLRENETDPIALHRINDFLPFAEEQYQKVRLANDELSNFSPPVPPPQPVPPVPGPPPGPVGPPGVPPISAPPAI